MLLSIGDDFSISQEYAVSGVTLCLTTPSPHLHLLAIHPTLMQR
jgi:hypothetical protein